jgi:DNA polymerase-1
MTTATLERYVVPARTMQKNIENSEVIYVDIETYHPVDFELAKIPEENHVRLITIGTRNMLGMVDVWQNPWEDIVALCESFKDKYIIGHNIKFDLKSLAHKIGWRMLPKKAFCTFQAARLLWFKENQMPPPRGTLKLENVVKMYLKQSMVKTAQLSNWGVDFLTQEQLQYALDDVQVLIQLADELVSIINKRAPKPKKQPDALGLRDTLFAIEVAYLPVLIKMELMGIPVNTEYLKQELKKAENEHFDAVVDCLAKYGIEPNKPQKCTYILNEKYGLKVEASNSDVLTKYRDTHPVVDSVLTSREKKKSVDLLESYLKVDKQGLLYTSFIQQRASSGRMSSTSPNVQQIPRKFKSNFYINRGGWETIKLDYPAIELRIAAVVADDPVMIQAFKEGKDPHRLTASLALGIAYEDIDPKGEDRQSAKPVNFGIIYGISAPSLQESAENDYGVKKPLKYWQDFIDKYLMAYPGINTWQRKTWKELQKSKDYFTFKDGKRKGQITVRTLLGREVKVWDYRKALNIPIQGTGAEMIKLASVYFNNTIKSKELDSIIRMVSVVHDEIIIEAKRSDRDLAVSMLSNSMQIAADSILKKFETVVEED